MIRKQALVRGKELLHNLEQTKEVIEIIKKIDEVLEELPFTNWSEQTIFDTIDQWIIENKKIPTTTDMAKKGLPPIPVIKNRFKMTCGDFLKNIIQDLKSFVTP